MEMYNPPHPGKILKNTYLPDCNLSVTAFALRIGVSRNTASELVNCKIGISAKMALRLEKLFDHKLSKSQLIFIAKEAGRLNGLYIQRQHYRSKGLLLHWLADHFNELESEIKKIQQENTLPS